MSDPAEQTLTSWSDPAARLRRALENNEFALFCQPIAALAGEERYPMAEVLVRLREEEKALLPPGEFLPVFEHFRMMPALDRWVVRETLRRLAAGSRIKCFTVNLSAQSLEDIQFPGWVAGELMAKRVAAGSLLFEIDESDTLARLDAAVRFAEAVRAIGVRVMVDGFGRRSVSFDAIKALSPHFVKVDGCIVRKLLTDAGAAAKMKAILRVSEALGFAIVAEFVEEKEMLLRLGGLGVGFAQGFGVFPPQPIDNVAAR